MTEHNSKTVRDALREITVLRQNHQLREAVQAYSVLIQELENAENVQELLAEVYLKNAKFLFQLGLHENSIDNLICAQQKGLLPSRIADFIPVLIGEEKLKEYRETYERQIQKITVQGYAGKVPGFDGLKLYFIPTRKDGNDYAVFDKENGFIDLAQQSYSGHVAANTDFSDYLIDTPWDIKRTASHFSDAETHHKHCYLLVDDVELFWATMQLPLAEEWFANSTIFNNTAALEKYFLSSGKYLPWHIVAGNAERVKELYEVLQNVHRQRLDRKNRKGDNVLLTIAIPSFNRGHRALESVLHCIKSHFDEEIEILVSDNASIEHQAEYRQIAELSDGRVHYYHNATNVLFGGNIIKVMELSRGKFTMLVSDEDMVDIGHLDSLLNRLQGREEQLAYLRTSIEGVQNAKYEALFLKRGHDTATQGILRNNYLTGIIYNKLMYAKSEVSEYLKSHSDNNACYFYPHMVIDVFLTQWGDVEFSSLITCHEGVDEHNIVSSELALYQNPEGRLKQHQDFFKIFVDVIQKHHLGMATAAEMLISLIKKTGFLLQVTILIEKSHKSVQIYFDSVMELYQYVVKDNLKVYKETLGFELSDDYRDQIRALFVSLIVSR